MTSPARWLLGATSDSGSVASVIRVNEPLQARPPVLLITLDGESCGDHAFSGPERDPYTDDGGES
jgi:hypothetical protein